MIRCCADAPRHIALLLFNIRMLMLRERAADIFSAMIDVIARYAPRHGYATLLMISAMMPR